MTSCPQPAAWTELDALAADARLALLDHARGCAACRARLLAEDPSRVFALLAVRPIPQATLDRVSSSVLASLDIHDLRVSTGRRAKLAGWAAAALLAVAVAGMLAGPVRAPRLDEDSADVAMSGPPLGAARADVELLSSPSTPEAARVVDLAVGETQIVMIFDERLDL